MEIYLNFLLQIKRMSKFQAKINFFILFLCLSNMYIVAQNVPPFAYMPPAGEIRWSNSKSYDGGYTFYMMDGITKIPANHDGLMEEFEIKMDLSKMEDVPLLRIGYMDDIFVQIMYTDETVQVARFNDEMKAHMTCWYTYKSFDRLFEKTIVKTSSDNSKVDPLSPISESWILRVYFTSRFMFIVSTPKYFYRNYMTPFYFGIDYSQKNSIMSKFLNRELWAWIWFGADDASEGVVVSNMKLYSFNYNDWYQQVQEEFSSPNPEKGD